VTLRRNGTSNFAPIKALTAMVDRADQVRGQAAMLV
jgi:hypothetical protein